MSDEIIEELWRIKDSIAREHGNDVRKLAAYLQGGNLREHSSGTLRRSTVDVLDEAPGQRLFKTGEDEPLSADEACALGGTSWEEDLSAMRSDHSS